MNRLKWNSAWGVALGFLLMASQAWGSCGCGACALPNFPETSMTPTAAMPVILGVDYEEINLNHPFLGTAGASVGAVTLHHDEVQTLDKRLTISLQGPVVSGVVWRVELPWIDRYHRHIHHHQGTDLPEIWDFSAWGDLSVAAKVRVLGTEKTDQWSLCGTLKLPTGVTAVENGDGDPAETSISPGSGSYDTTWGLYYQHSYVQTAVPISGSILYTAYGNGTEGWRFGNKWAANLMVQTQVGDQWRIGLALNGMIQLKSDPGSTGEPVDSTGGTYLYLTPELQCSIGLRGAVYVLIQIPVYRNVNSIQLTSDLNAKMGVSWGL